MRNPFAHGGFQDRSRPFLWGVAIVLGLLLAGSFWVRPAWRSLKDRRAMVFVAKARAAMAVTNFVESKANLLAAYELAPFHPEVFRMAAEHYTRLGRPYGLQVWEQLEATGAMTDADRLQWAGLAVDCRSYEVARKALAPFAATDSKDPDALKLLSELYLAAGKEDSARQAALAAWQFRPDRSDLLLHLGRIEFANADPQISRFGQARLMSLLVESNPVAGAAALAFLEPAASNRVDLRLIARLIEGLPDADTLCALAKLVARGRAASPAKAREMARAFVHDRKLNADDPRFMTVVLGLVSLREFPLVSELVTEDLAVRAEDLSSVRLEALFRMDDWASVESLLDRKNAKVSKPVAATYRAMVGHAHGRTNELPNLWRAAIAASQRSPQVLEIVAERAEYTGSRAEAILARRELLSFAESGSRAAKDILRLTADSPDLESAYQAYRLLSRLSPGDANLRLQLALHQLLLRVGEADARRTLAEGEAAFPDKNFFRITAALAALLDKDPDSAARSVEAMTGGSEGEPRLWRVVRAAALGRSGQTAKARDALLGFKSGQLSAAEFGLVKEWLR